MDCPNIKEIILPKSLKTLGAFAFCGSEVENIDLPEGLELIGIHAFYCSAKEIVVPESVLVLEDRWLDDCKKAKVLKIPKHLRGYFLNFGDSKVVYY